MRVLFYLIDSLSHIHTASLQFDVDDRHTIDEQHHIATASSAQWVLCLELWLTHNLIDALSGTHLLGIEDGQIHLLAEVDLVILVISLNHHLTAIDELIHLVWVLQIIYLSHDLLHLGVCQWEVTQTVHVSVVVIDDGCPVLNEGFLCWIHQYLWFPSMLWEKVSKGFLKVEFLCERTDINIYCHCIVVFLSYTNILSKHADLICFSFSSSWVWRVI